MENVSDLSIRFRCDYCDAELEVEPNRSGQTCTCPECLRILVIPSMTSFRSTDVTAIENEAVGDDKLVDSQVLFDEPPPNTDRIDAYFEKVAEEGSAIAQLNEVVEIVQNDRKYIKFRCDCNQKIKFPADTGRTKGNCPKCGKMHAIPEQYLVRPEPAKRADPKAKAVESSELVPDDAPGQDASRSANDHAAEILRKHLTDLPTPEDPSRANMVSAWPRAELLERLLSGLIDGAVALGAAAVFLVFLKIVGMESSTRLAATGALVTVILWAMNDCIGSIYFRASVGKKLMGIEIRASGTGDPILRNTAIVRTVVKWPLGLILFPMIFMEGKHKAFHDRISDTRVMRMPKRK